MDFHGPKTQKLIEGTATNQTIVAYTVPVGKKFFLVSSMVRSDGGAVGEVRSVIRNDSDVIQIGIGYIKIGATTLVVPSVPFTPGFPVELTEGWDIAVISGAAGLLAGLEAFGFEVDA